MVNQSTYINVLEFVEKIFHLKAKSLSIYVFVIYYFINNFDIQNYKNR